MLGHRTFGRPTSAMLRLFGAEALGGKIDKLCRYVPRQVTVRIPEKIAPGASFLIDSDHGRDQIAATIWWKGWDGYEGLVMSLFGCCARESKWIIDVGANTGLFALTAAACSPGAAVHAFEPFPPCRKLLDNNLQLNGMQSRVKTRPEAVSEQAGQMNLYVPKEDRAGYDETSCSLNADFRPEHSQVIPVPVTTLDLYCKEQKIDRLDLLKVDVESFEPQVLRGAAEVIARDRPPIFLEVLVVADVAALNAFVNEYKYAPLLLTHDHLEILPRVAYCAGHMNQLFWPVERLGALKQLAGRLGYPVVGA
jgi:FkbM family methyltransferase